jgi:hypothetical protein
MNNFKTKKYKYEVCDYRYIFVLFLKDYFNQIWFHPMYMERDKMWGTKDYYRRLPFNKPMINSNTEEEYVISDWVESLDNKYHQLYPELGDRLWMTLYHRGGKYDWRVTSMKKWDKYRRTFNRILKEIIYDGKLYYDDEERIVMNLFREFYQMYKDIKWFNYWKENLKEEWGETNFIR